MDSEDFKTLGECDFGTIWEVQSENKIVVNAYQAALYFAREDFLQFARMVEESVITLTGKGFQQARPDVKAPGAPRKEASPEPAPQITDIRAFRRHRQHDDDDQSPS